MQLWSRLGRPAWPERIIAGVAVLNFLYVAWEESNTSGGCIVCPWYYPWHWTNLPTRLLLAAVLLLVAHWASRAVATALAGQALLLAAWFFFSLDEIAVVFRRGYPESLLPVQGVVAAAIVSCGAARLSARLLRRRALRVALVAVVAAVVLGYASSVVGARACKDHVARWVAREALSGRPFQASEGIDGWADSFSVFRRVGADVRQRDHDSEGAGETRAMIRPTLCPLPFVVRVSYGCWREGEGAWTKSGEQLFVVGPGFVKRVESAEPWLRDLDRSVIDVAAFPWSRYAAVPW